MTGTRTDTTTSARRSRVSPSARVVALTILWHPDLEKVGHRALLPDLDFGGEASVSRTEPRFGAPGSAAHAPLGDRSVSRAGLRIRCEGDRIVLTPEASRRAVCVDGAPLQSPKTLPGDALEHGILLEPSARVALLIHRVAAESKGRPDLGMIGRSDALEQLREQILNIADRDVPVLLLGESGTGKELAARAIHAQGAHATGPFVSVNMAAIPAGTAAAQLFGHKKGAFTGAATEAQGYFERADGGTLFLDEVGATPLEIQAALLRVLETGELQPVGAPSARVVSVRVVAATDLDLDAEVDAGRFRLPLLHRLRGYEIVLPALRHRRDDLGRLLVHFIKGELERGPHTARLAPGGQSQWLPASLVAEIARHPLEGNIRELRNLARRIVIDSAGAEEVDPKPILDFLSRRAGSQAPRAAVSRLATREEPSEEAVLDALERAEFKPSQAAEALGISRTTVYAVMKRSAVLRKAAELTETEIRDAIAAHDGDIGGAALMLRVSERGLRLRMTQLGIRQANG